MAVIVGVWFALAGAVAVLAGWSGMLRRRRLRRTGLTAWALIVPSPSTADEPTPVASRRVHVQFALADGRIIERPCARPIAKSAALVPGKRVLVWYDAADPGEVLLYGRGGRQVDRVFLVAGTAFVLVGCAIAIFTG
jgi:Protein of unknown function (DUF3592)